jgi:SAM-dependent methyltransferase
MDRDEWNERYRTRELIWTAAPNRFLVAEVSDLEPGRALDLAAGEGRNALWLASQGWATTAADYSDVAIAKARELAGANGVTLETVVSDATQPLPGGSTFDLVVVAYLQLPEPDRTAALRNAAAAVAAGGTLLVIAHDEANLEGGYGGPQDPAVLTGPSAVAEVLDGFAIEKAERVERVVETADGPRVAIDHVVRARRPPER